MKAREIRDPQVIDPKTGKNPTRVDPKKIKKATTHQLIEAGERPVDFNAGNPNPYEAFQGQNGQWYKLKSWSCRGNCYAYAMGWAIDAATTGWFIPGFLVGRIPRDESEIIPCICDDLKKVGRAVHQVIMEDEIPEQLPEAPKGTYWVKLYLNGDFITGFHIARKDEITGRWIHKLGWACPPKVVMDNKEAGYPPEIKESIEFLQFMGLPINVPKDVIASNWETNDRASYKARDPESCKDFEIYEPFAVMLIDE